MTTTTPTTHPHSSPLATSPVRCLNCGYSYAGHYCSQCGQRADTHPINWHYIWHEIPHSLWHLDRGILFTLRQLFTRPGYSIGEFLAGKRINHYRPLALLLILGTLVVFASHSLGVSFAEQGQRVFGPASADLSDRTRQFQTQIIHFVEKYQTILHIATIPLYAFWFWLLFRGRGYTYPEQLVVQTFVANTNLVVLLVTVLLFWLLGGSAAAFSVVMSLILVVMIGYNAVVYSQLLREKVKLRAVILRSITAYGLGYVSFSLVGALAGILYVVINMQQLKNGGHVPATKRHTEQAHH